MLILIGQIATIVTAIFVAVGGIIGFKKAGSKPSLIAGVVSGVVLGICFGVSYVQPLWGLGAALFTLIVLQGVFGVRVKKTKKFMPAGMMLIICIFGEVAVLCGVLGAAGIVNLEQDKTHASPIIEIK